MYPNSQSGPPTTSSSGYPPSYLPSWASPSSSRQLSPTAPSFEPSASPYARQPYPSSSYGSQGLSSRTATTSSYYPPQPSRSDTYSQRRTLDPRNDPNDDGYISSPSDYERRNRPGLGRYAPGGIPPRNDPVQQLLQRERISLAPRPSTPGYNTANWKPRVHPEGLRPGYQYQAPDSLDQMEASGEIGPGRERSRRRTPPPDLGRSGGYSSGYSSYSGRYGRR